MITNQKRDAILVVTSVGGWAKSLSYINGTNTSLGLVCCSVRVKPISSNC